MEIEEREKRLILAICEHAYGAARYELPSDWMTYEHFYRVVRNLEFRSSPGYPYCLSGSSIGEWLGWDGVGFNENRVEELWYDVHAFLSGERSSLYRVFIKGEPHTVLKAEAGRWRLIICPPLYEQVAWTMVFGTGNDKEIETVGLTPSFQGMSLPGGNWRYFLDIFRMRGLDVSMDKSAWDWTAHREFISLDLDLRARLLVAPPQDRERWLQLAKKLYEGAFDHPTLVLSDGSCWTQLHPGVMKSGCVNTISSNSHMQLFVHILACLRNGVNPHPLPVAVGDDTLGSRDNLLDVSAYRFTGAVVKELVKGRDFVGHRWSEEGMYPLYSAKHFVRYSITPLDHLPEFLDSMVRLYAHSAEFQNLWRDLASRRQIMLPSVDFVRFWYDYPSDVIYG